MAGCLLGTIIHLVKLCTSKIHFAPFSFVAIIPCPNFKVIHCQWLESRFLFEQNACSGCNHSHSTVVISKRTSGWSETNVICSHSSRHFGITWSVPVQFQTVLVSVQAYSQVLNRAWNQICRREGIMRELTVKMFLTSRSCYFPANVDLSLHWLRSRSYVLVECTVSMRKCI